MDESSFTFTQLISLSIVMSLFFAFDQVIGFVARILFRLTLDTEAYGVFAFLINIFVFFVGLNSFSMNVPIIARISENPSDDDFYKSFSGQVFTSSTIFGAGLSIIFFIWTLLTTNEFIIVLFLALMILIHSSDQIMHCFPRGRERFRPVAVSLLLVGFLRIVFLMPFVFGFFTDLLYVVILYVTPFLGWWVSYIYFEGVPSFKFPKLGFLRGVYTDAFISYLYPLGMQLPVVLGIVLLTSFHGFQTAGDFDIALLPFLALASLFTGISFVTISKARRLPSFRILLNRMKKSVALPMSILSITLLMVAYLFESSIKPLLTWLDLPLTVYWPIVLLVSIGVPLRIAISMLVSYFQGQGRIKPVGAIIGICSIGSIPIQGLFAYYLSIDGVILCMLLITAAIVFLLLIFGYRDSETSNGATKTMVRVDEMG